MNNLLLVLFLFCPTLVFPDLLRSPSTYEVCVQRLRRNLPYMARRYSYDQIAWLCEQTTLWSGTEEAYGPYLKEKSQDQQLYIDQIRRCQTSDCIYLANRRKAKRQIGNTYTRKEYRALNDTERTLFHDAVISLKISDVDGISKYDLLINEYLSQLTAENVWGCNFVYLNNDFLLLFETAMRIEVPHSAIPYWDSSLDQKLPDPCDSIIWSEEFMGDNRGLVKSGPFTNWESTWTYPGLPTKKLFRNCGRSKVGTLYETEDFVYYQTKKKEGDLICSCNDPVFQVSSGLVHDFVGGYMEDTLMAANDPLFLSHRAFVDYLWLSWRKESSSKLYLDETGSKKTVCFKSNGIGNYTVTPFFYDYAPRPTCSIGCVGDYLYCNTDNFVCMAKIKPGGFCNNFENKNICTNGYQCIDGICKRNK